MYGLQLDSWCATGVPLDVPSSLCTWCAVRCALLGVPWFWCAIECAKSSLCLVCTPVCPSAAVAVSGELCAANHLGWQPSYLCGSEHGELWDGMDLGCFIDIVELCDFRDKVINLSTE